MLRNGKAIALTLMTLVMAGCAQSDYVTSRNQRARWYGGDRVAVSKTSQAVPPKILPETYFAAGQLFEAQGLFGKAIIQYRKAVAISHDYVEALHRLGVLLGTIGRHEEAIEALSRAAELTPGDHIVRNNLGFELMLNRQWADAEREFRRAIDKEPRFARAHVNLGIALSKLGRFDEALASFLAVLPEPDAYYNFGLTLRGHQKYRQAAEAFNHALSIDPDFTAATRQLEQIAERLKHSRDSQALNMETQENIVAEWHPPLESGAEQQRELMNASIIYESVSDDMSERAGGFEQLYYTPFEYREGFDADFEPCPDDFFDHESPFDLFDDTIDWIKPRPVEEPGVVDPSTSMSSLIGAGPVIADADRRALSNSLPFPPPLAMQPEDLEDGPWTDEPVRRTLAAAEIIDRSAPQKVGQPVLDETGVAIADVGPRFDIPFTLAEQRSRPFQDSYSGFVLTGRTVGARPVMASKVMETFVRESPIDRMTVIKSLEEDLNDIRQEIDCWEGVAAEREEARKRAERIRMDLSSDAAGPSFFVPVCDLETELDFPAPPGVPFHLAAIVEDAIFAAADSPMEETVAARRRELTMASIIMLPAPKKSPAKVGRPILASAVCVEPVVGYSDEYAVVDMDVTSDIMEHLPSRWDPAIEDVRDLMSIVQNEVDCWTSIESEEAESGIPGMARDQSTVPPMSDHVGMGTVRFDAYDPIRLQK